MSQLISDEYRMLNAEKHKSCPAYGAHASYGTGRWERLLNKFTWELETFSVLDYGCGKGDLARAMTKMAVQNYDPAIEEFATTPEPADIVICTDVMEHIEPDCLDAVIEDLKRVSNIMLIVNVSLQLAMKTMADGRNAHLIVEPIDFWMKKFMKYFDLHYIDATEGEQLTMVLYARTAH